MDFGNCENCGYYFQPGTSTEQVEHGCPNCGRPYRSQPNPVADEMRLRNMPEPGGDDMGGNPLKEGILADNGWKPLKKRDESFASVQTTKDLQGLMWHDAEYAEVPMEATEVIPPSAKFTDAPHKVTVQFPNGITQNLHDALKKTNAWVENPYENGQLRPYNSHWKVLRTSLSPGSVRIGVSDPMHAEIINHVAQTDEPAQLQTRTAGPAVALLPEAAGAAGLGAGEAAGAGGIGGLMGGALSVGRGYMGVKGLENMMGGGDNGGGSTPSDPNSQPEGTPYQDSSYYAAAGDDFDSPGSITKREDTDDPEKVDPHEKNDGDNKDWQKDFSVNGEGGTTTQPGFAPDGPAMTRFKSLLPLVMHYFHSEESGEHDPLIKGLHEALEGELPGYLNHAHPHSMQKLIMVVQGQGKKSRVANPGIAYPGEGINGPGMSGEGVPASPAVRGHCPTCGSTTSPDDQICPQCGSGMVSNLPFHPETKPRQPGEPTPDRAQLQPIQPTAAIYDPAMRNKQNMNTSILSSDTQGPHTPEQLAAVAQLLQDEGRADEISNMILSPHDYADELAKIQHKDEPPGGDLNNNPPAPPVEATPPNAGMPMPGMSGPSAQAMMTAALKYGADSIADACPKCDSHTTKLLDQDGESQCHNCGHIYKTDVNPTDAGSSDFSKSADIHHDPEVSILPAADHTKPEDKSKEQDSSHTWQDQNGQPLQVGQEYEVYSDKYDIPDIVQITAVKPDAVEWILTGEHGLNTKQEITHQEALLDGLTFKPFGSNDAQGDGRVEGIEHNDDTVNQTQPGYEQSDMSTPSMMVGSSVKEDGEVHNNPALDWLLPRTAGAKFSPMEQREFIEEAGVARNSDKLDLEGTHYQSANVEDSFLFGW